MKNNEWISVKDRLPEKNGEYLVVIHFVECERTNIGMLKFSTKLSNILWFNYKGSPINGPANNYNHPGFYLIDYDLGDCWEVPDVTHWMELPELPEEVKRNDG